MKVTNRTAQAWLAFACVYGGALLTVLCFAGIALMIAWFFILATN